MAEKAPQFYRKGTYSNSQSPWSEWDVRDLTCCLKHGMSMKETALYHSRVKSEVSAEATRPGFSRSKCVGAHYGLTPRLYQSGEVARMGRISRCGDAMLRSSLYEAALVVLTGPGGWNPLKAWGVAVARRREMQKAIVAVARKPSFFTECGETTPASDGLPQPSKQLKSWRKRVGNSLLTYLATRHLVVRLLHVWCL